MRVVCVTATLLAAAVLFAQDATPAAESATPPGSHIIKSRPLEPPSPPRKHVVIIDIKNMITYGLAASVDRRIKEAQELEADLIVFLIDSPGGTVSDSIDLSDRIAGVREPLTVAYVPKEAISGAALTALSCQQMVVGPHALVGDVQPILQTTEGVTPAGEKIETVLRGKFRSLAERNNYPVALSEAMVSEALEIHKVQIEGEPQPRYVRSTEAESLKREFDDAVVSDTIVVPKGELLTMTGPEAYDFGFARAVISRDNDQDFSGLLAYYNASGAQVTQFGPNWSEELVRFLDVIGPILLAAGLLGVYLELKSPGFGLPGIIGISCLALFFGSKYMVGLADFLDILLFVVGVVLLSVELFVIPGFGIVGIAGVLMIFAGLLLSFQPFVVPTSPTQMHTVAWSFAQLIAALVVTVVGGALLGRLLPHLPFARGLVLVAAPTTAEAFASAAPTGHRLEKFLGATGTTTTYCRPAGKALVGNELVDVVAQGQYIERGRRVKVIDLEGNRVVVRAEESET